jgi:flagellar hook protein FlgE
VRGRGFLPVTSGTALISQTADFPMNLTTTGSFRTDANGFLRTSTGLVLLGWPANPDGAIPTYPRDTSDGLAPVQIQTNQFAAEPTTAITLGVNLPRRRRNSAPQATRSAFRSNTSTTSAPPSRST